MVGDAADIRTSSAGSVAHFGCETVVDELGHLLEGDPLVASSDGDAHCFIETRYHEAVPAPTPDGDPSSSSAWRRTTAYPRP
jgi:hypothetical protein